MNFGEEPLVVQSLSETELRGLIGGECLSLKLLAVGSYQFVPTAAPRLPTELTLRCVLCERSATYLPIHAHHSIGWVWGRTGIGA